MPLSDDLHRAYRHYHAGRLDLAQADCRSVLAGRPLDPGALHLLGVVALRTRSFDEAIDLLRRAIGARPAFPDAYSNLAVALEARGQLTKAENACRAALRLDSGHAGAWTNLGNILGQRERTEEAAGAYRAALRARPDEAAAYSGLGTVLLDQCRHDEAVACFRRACELSPGSASARSDLLYNLHYHDAYDAAALYREHVKCGACFQAVPFNKPPARRECGPQRIRLGYVSPDFRDHTVPRFIGATIERHDRGAFEVFLYSDVTRPDATTERLRAAGHGWRDCVALDDGQLFDLIREDRIDVLVDLRGHGANNRLPVFARRAAPIQVTMVGYFDTTGLSAMDYRITDERMDPPGETERYHTERLIRLPHSCWCYRPDADAPDVAPTPALRAGFVTFGSLNKVAKISPACARLWARVLDAVPDSRLRLAAPGGGADRTLLARLSEMGLPAGRVDLAPHTATRRGYLESFGAIDIALDTFPFNGITTTCDGLWMGVPLVSLAGGTSVSRAGASILHALGLPELATTDADAFVSAAAALARDLERLRTVRRGLRDRFAASPLRDEAGFTRALEAAFGSLRAGRHEKRMNNRSAEAGVCGTE